MTENSRAGLTMLAPDREVVVTCEEHQPALQVHAPPADGQAGHVVVELGFPTGRPGIEIRLDGQRVGELTAPMSARYGPLIDDVLVHGGRPACVARVVDGRRGLELVLRLPEVPVGAALPPESPLPLLVGAPEARGRQRTPYLVGAGVAALLIVVGLSLGHGGLPTVPAADGGAVVVATTTAAAPTPTVAAGVTTTRRAPAAPPPAHSAAPQPAPAPEPAEAAPEPSDECDPNYDECVPVADDVDCADDDGDGPAFVSGPVEVIGVDIYDLDPDEDGIACD